MNKSPYYKRHIFLCTNQREGGRGCARLGAAEALSHCKARVRELGLSGVGNTRVSSSGCLARCELGPTLVVYPEGTWYSYVSLEEVDEIVEHVARGEVAERLQI